MKRSSTIGAIVAGAAMIVALGVGTATAATVSVGHASDGTTCGMQQGNGNGQGNGRQGNGGHGNGTGSGNAAGAGMGMSGLNVDGVASGTLSDEQKSALANLAEEEKLAHDVYVTLGEQYPDAAQFSHISQSETRHLDALRTLLDRYGVADPTAGTAPNTFTSTQFQQLYTQLVTGATTSEAALDAGVTIEEADIAALQDARSSVTAPDVAQVYDALITASQRHLAAFSR